MATPYIIRVKAMKSDGDLLHSKKCGFNKNAFLFSNGLCYAGTCT